MYAVTCTRNATNQQSLLGQDGCFAQTALLKASSGAIEESPYKSPSPLKGGALFLKLRAQSLACNPQIVTA